MVRMPEAEAVKGTLEAFFASLDGCDRHAIREIWHPEARLFLNNATLNARPLSFLLSLPDLMGFRVKEIRDLKVDGSIATARVDYHLSVGLHSGYFSLVNAGGRWQIANWIDHAAGGA